MSALLLLDSPLMRMVIRLDFALMIELTPLRSDLVRFCGRLRLCLSLQVATLAATGRDGGDDMIDKPANNCASGNDLHPIGPRYRCYHPLVP